MNPRKFKRTKFVEQRKDALKQIKKAWQEYAKAERAEGREPLTLKDWIDAKEKTW